MAVKRPLTLLLHIDILLIVSFLSHKRVVFVSRSSPAVRSSMFLRNSRVTLTPSNVHRKFSVQLFRFKVGGESVICFSTIVLFRAFLFAGVPCVLSVALVLEAYP